MDDLKFFGLILFFVAIGTFFIIGIAMQIAKALLKRRLEKKYPKIWVQKLSFMALFDFSPMKDGYKMMISFGAKENVMKFNSHFFDIKTIGNLSDGITVNYLKSLFFLTSVFAKLWIITLGSLIILCIAHFIN